MDIFFTPLTYPFIQRALVAGLVLAFLLAVLGVYVLIKRMAFFASGMAHASLAGIAIGIVFSINPLLSALVLSIIFSIIIFVIEKKYALSSDTLIGIIFTAGMAFGVLLISLRPGFQPELLSFLFGNILAIQTTELIFTVIASMGLLITLWRILNQLTLVALDPDLATTSGVRTMRLQLFLYIALAITVVLSIKMLGIVLVSALLVIPVAAAKIVAQSFRFLMIYSIILAEITVLFGIFLSYFLDWPTGPTIVLLGTVLFVAHVVIFNGQTNKQASH